MEVNKTNTTSEFYLRRYMVWLTMLAYLCAAIVPLIGLIVFCGCEIFALVRWTCAVYMSFLLAGISLLLLLPRNSGQWRPASVRIFILGVLLIGESGAVAETPQIRGGSELDFRPYCFTDNDRKPVGFGPDLLKAAADKMGLNLQITPGPWNKIWDDLVAGRLDVLPIVARTPGREPLVEFCLPHTQTFDAFFVREGSPFFQKYRRRQRQADRRVAR